MSQSPISLFHITAIDNLDSIAKVKCLYSKNAMGTTAYNNIANQGIQQRRAIKTVDVSPHGTLYDYVPFYFAPRSPMLHTINQGEEPKIDGYCKYWFSDPNNPKYISRMETRQAEFLVKEQFDLDLIEYIAVINQEKKDIVDAIFERHPIDIEAVVKPSFYF